MNEAPLFMNAYYYHFEPTGVIEIDRILSAVACAGAGYHNTEDWNDDVIKKIQDAAYSAAKAWRC